MAEVKPGDPPPEDQTGKKFVYRSSSEIQKVLNSDTRCKIVFGDNVTFEGRYSSEDSDVLVGTFFNKNRLPVGQKELPYVFLIN